MSKKHGVPDEAIRCLLVPKAQLEHIIEASSAHPDDCKPLWHQAGAALFTEYNKRRRVNYRKQNGSYDEFCRSLDLDRGDACMLAAAAQNADIMHQHAVARGSGFVPVTQLQGIATVGLSINGVKRLVEFLDGESPVDVGALVRAVCTLEGSLQTTPYLKAASRPVEDGLSAAADAN